MPKLNKSLGLWPTGVLDSCVQAHPEVLLVQREDTFIDKHYIVLV